MALNKTALGVACAAGMCKGMGLIAYGKATAISIAIYSGLIICIAAVIAAASLLGLGKMVLTKRK